MFSLDGRFSDMHSTSQHAYSTLKLSNVLLVTVVSKNAGRVKARAVYTTSLMHAHVVILVLVLIVSWFC